MLKSGFGETRRNNAAKARRKIHLGFFAIMILFLVVMLSWSWRSWLEAKDYEFSHLRKIAEVTGNSIENYFSLQELQMQVFASELAPILAKSQSSLSIIMRFQQGHPDCARIIISEPKGRILATNLSEDPSQQPPTINSPERRIAIQALIERDGMNIGRPVESRTTKEWVMPLRIGIRDDQQQLKYVVNCQLPLNKQQSFWHNLDLPKGSSLALLRDDAYLVSRYPTPEGGDLNKMYGNQRTGALIAYLRENNFPQRGIVQGHSSVAKTETLFAFHRLEKFQVSAFVAIPLSGAIARWKEQMFLPGFLALFALLAGVLMFRSINRQIDIAEEIEEHRNDLEKKVSERTESLEKAKLEAESSSEAKSSFLATMSHELRTPLSGIIGMIRLAKMNCQNNDALDQLRKATTASEHLMSVINDILDISKIEARQLEIEKASFKLVPVFEGLISMLGHKANGKGIKLDISISPDLIQQGLLGDSLRISQVVTNLTMNALKFTERGGVTLSVMPLHSDDAEVVLRFEVIDTGIGISEEQQAKLFHSFEQADSSISRKYGGSGLGLAISKELVELMGGTIGVTSQPDQGSTFWFELTLPKTTEDAYLDSNLSEEDLAEQIRALHTGKRVLLVEDEPIIQEISRMMLEEVGLVVDFASTGLEGVKFANESTYNLILMDMQMPEMNGVDATILIKKDTLNRETPILAMTANAFYEDRERCLSVGMKEHIAKPVEPVWLFAALLRWL